MNYITKSPRSSRRMRSQSGLGMVEMLVSVVLGLFLVLGLSRIFLSMYSTSSSENLVTQYRDNQRIAVTMLSNVIQAAGYFYNPTAQTAATALPALTNADTSVFTAGVGITGIGPGNGITTLTSDSVDVFYLSSGADNMYSCQGDVASSATGYVNTFSLNSSNQLVCTVGTVVGGVVTATSGPLVLVTGIGSLNILYGVDVAGTGSVSSYLSGDSVQTAGLWASVRTVRITLNFLNVNAMDPTTALTTTTSWVQTINLMRQS